MKHSGIIGALWMGLLGAAWAAPAVPPHLSPIGQDEYRGYLEAPNHRAFAIAPGGAYGWTSGESSAANADEMALAICQGQTELRCVSYAVDDKVVFDTAAWPKLWRPYASAAQAKKAAVGRERGQRMHDLAFKDAQGKQRQLSSLLGKVVVLHFWGAWCPPCRREMPDLQKVQKALQDRHDIVFVILQAREKFEVSRQWAEHQELKLPLADSGSTGEDDPSFSLADGGKIKDREIASRFPTTYVLDQRGLIVFSHVGPLSDWPQYEAFLRDLAEAGKR
jgi:thiol-disulfide isomerase/thioredoxin